MSWQDWLRAPCAGTAQKSFHCFRRQCFFTMHQETAIQYFTIYQPAYFRHARRAAALAIFPLHIFAIHRSGNSMHPDDQARRRRYGAAFLFALMFLLSIAPATAQTLPDIHAPEAQMICSSSGLNTDPWLSGIAVAQPGRWWNPKRYGTGWDLVYNDDRTKLKVFMYTFNASGHSTWLATRMTHIQETGELWRADLYEYRKSGTTISSTKVGEVLLRFFRDDPSRAALRWKWDAIPATLLPPAGYSEECLHDMTRLNPTYYAGFSEAPTTVESFAKDLAVSSGANQTFSGYWNNSTQQPIVDQVPGVVMTLMQVSLGPERGKWGEAVVRLTFNNAPVGNPDRGAPVFVQAQRVTLATQVPLGQDTFNLYYHYGLGYPNGYALNDCSASTGCNNNLLVGTYTRTFLSETSYRSANTIFFIDPARLTSSGAVNGAPAINGIVNPTYLGAGNDSAAVTRTTRLQDISVNQYVCQASTGGNCTVWVSWAGNGIGKAWRRDLTSLNYSPVASEDFGVAAQQLTHGDRVQFELWQGTPGTAAAVLLDKTPEVRAVGPTPPANGPIDVPPAPVVSNLADLPTHQTGVGALAGAADVSGGAASYTVPIQVPPGRNGLQPEVSLSYSSRGGNGIAGLGWSLDAGSSITRCPRTLDQDGQIRGIRLDANDALCLDGQRLVGVAGNYGTAGAQYRTEIDSFTRITQNGSAANISSGGVCFTVEHKNGQKAIYGCLPAVYSCASGYVNPRLRPTGTGREQSWLISRVEDPAGNTMDYCYGMPELSGGEILLESIRYTGSLHAASNAIKTPSRVVDFDYAPRPTQGRANDRSSSAVAGGMTHQTHRLTTISTYSPDSPHPARRYKLDYTNPQLPTLDASYYSGRSLLRSISECAYSPSGAETCRDGTEFTWTDGSWEFSSRKLAIANNAARNAATPAPKPEPIWQEGNESATAPAFRRNEVIPLGDLDGDGTREILITHSWYSNGWQSEWQLSKVTADRTVKGIVTLSGFPMGRAADIDGDGISEIVSGTKIFKYSRGRGTPLCDGGASTCSATADSYFQTLTTNLLPNGKGFVESLSDFNGDGAPDALVRLTPSEACDGSPVLGTRNTVPLCLFLNTRPGPITPGTTSFTFALTGQIQTLSTGPLTESVQHVGDLDGNGVTDVVVATKLGIHRVLLGQYSSGSFSYSAQTPSALGIRSYTKNLRWMDINADGLDDIVIGDLSGAQNNCANGSCHAHWVLQLNRGETFSPEIHPANPPGMLGPGLATNSPGYIELRYFSKMIQADIDADGRSDLLYPAHFAARICFSALLTREQFLTPRPHEDCSNGPCLADVCPAPPPEDASLNYLAHPGQAPDWADTFRSGMGEVDPSAYRYNAIRFVQTGPDSFRLQVDETPIVLGASQLGGQQIIADDYFGDGLADVVADAGCPLRPTETFPHNVCRLSAGGANGPGSTTSYLDTAQTIQLGQLVDPANINLVINENLGDGARAGLSPQFPDMLGKAVDALGDQVSWEYFPLSSSAGRTGTDFPLYKIDAGYVDARHFLFQSSMPVVSVMARSNGVTADGEQTFGGRSMRYAYEGAMYNAHGRGFQGFRKISTEPIAPQSRIARTTTTFHQKFPLAGRIERIETTIPATTRRLSLETFIWRCDRNDTSQECPGQSGTAPPNGVTYWPFVHQSSKRHYDLVLAEAGNSVITGRIDTFNAQADSNQSGWTAEGNLHYQRVVTRDGDSGQPDGDKYYLAGHETITLNNFDTSASTLAAWWMDKLTDSTVTESVSYFPRSGGTPAMDLTPKTVSTAYTWNTNRTLATKTVTDQAASQSLTAQHGYPTPNLGLPNSVILSGSGIAPAREMRTEYSADGYFPASVTGVLNANQPALNHVSTTTVRASDGQISSVTDAAGLKTSTIYDPFGFAVQIDYYRTDHVTPLKPSTKAATTSVCGSCGSAGVGGETAAYAVTTVQDGSPSVRTWYDLLNREIKRATRGFDGRWVNVSTQFDAQGSTESTTAPFFDSETPLRTVFTYDRFDRMLSKRSPTAELNSAQGDLRTTYNYSGLRTDITVTPVSGNCAANPHICFTVRRHVNTLGQLMRTEDALTGTYAGTTLGGITDYWLNPQGKAAATRDGKANTISASYNALGHRLSSNDPNQGNWSFSYNALGELLTQTDARGVQTSVIQRDGLGRTLMQRRQATAGVPASLTDEKVLDSWQYDISGLKGAMAMQQRQRSSALGNPENSVPDWKESYNYDLSSGRLIQRTTQIEQAAPNALTLTYIYQYDPYYGYPTAITYPNTPQPLTVWKRYTRYGMPSGFVDARLMTPLWSMSEADAFGKPTKEQFGYTLYAQASYSRATGQVRSQSWRPYELPTFTGNLDELSYAYDILGNLSRQERNWRRYDENALYNSVLKVGVDRTGRTVENYTYDKVQRLTDVSRTRRSGQSWVDTPADPAVVSYRYDAVGNITSKSDYADSYSYGSSSGCGPNAVTTIYSANGGSPQQRSFQCDLNGNQISETGSGPATQNRTIVYDGANLPTRIGHSDTWTVNALVEYSYGPDNARYRRNGDGGTLYFGADGYEYEVAAGGSSKLHRIELGPAVYTRQIVGTTVSPSVTSYQIRDRLGSTIGVADRWGNFNGSGQPVSADGLLRRSYDPFGMPREAGLGGVYRPNNYILPTLQLNPATRRGFTNHEHVDTVKLVHMNGRMYDYRTGRFLNVDPIIKDADGSQGLNPYSYILNNPLSGIDPSGYAACKTSDSKSCLEEGVNTVTDEAGNESIVIVTEKGARVEVATSNGSYSGTFTGTFGKISGVFSGEAPSSLGEISDRTGGAISADVLTTGIGRDAGFGSEVRGYFATEQLRREAEDEARQAEIWRHVVETEAIERTYPEEFLPVGRAANASKSALSWAGRQISSRMGRRGTANQGGALILKSAGAAVNRSVNFGSQSQIAKKFSSHAEDFGILGPWNKANGEAFVKAMQAHIDDPATVLIQGTYRWKQDVTHFYNPNTNLFLMRDANFDFISGWRLSPRQAADLLGAGNVY